MRLTSSILGGLCVAVLSGLICAYTRLDRENAILSLLLGFGSIPLFFVHAGSQKPFRRTWFVGIAIFGLVFARYFGWLIYREGTSVLVHSPHAYSDLALHITYLRYFANGASFWPENPVFVGVKLHYPIGMDFLNSLLLLAGVPLETGLVAVALLCGSLTAITLAYWGGNFAILSFLFNGGLAGFFFFYNPSIYSYQWELAWKNIPLALFVPQRGYLFAVPAGLFLLMSWKKRFFLGKDEPRLMPPILELVTYASLPLFHMHSFTFLSLVLAYWFLTARLAVKKAAFGLVALAFLPACFFVREMTSSFHGFSIVHVRWGWIQDPENRLWFWLNNFGLFLPCALVLILCLIFGKKLGWHGRELTADRAFVIPAAILFVFFCIVMTHPNDWDNIKMFFWSYIMIMPTIYERLLAKRSIPFQLVMGVLFFWTGILATIEYWSFSRFAGFELYNEKERLPVEEALKGVPIESRIAAAPEHTSPVLLSGHPQIIGYPGHVWVHGFQYGRQLQMLTDLMNGRGDWCAAAERLGARYLFWGRLEKEKFPFSGKPWEALTPPMSQGGWGALYDLAPACHWISR